MAYDRNPPTDNGQPNPGGPDRPPGNGQAPGLQENPTGSRPSRGERVMPQSEEAEKGVLSSMMLSPNECIGAAMEKLTANQFYNRGRQILFEVMVELHDGGAPVDQITLTSLLRDRKQLDFVGGPSELAEIQDYVPSPAHFDYYAEILQDKYVLREIIEAAGSSIDQAYDDVPSVGDLLDHFERDSLAIRERLEKGDGIKDMRKQVMDAVAQIEEMFQNRGGLAGIPTGYGDLDSMTNGMTGGQMIVIAARPSMGKTSLAMNIVENVSLKEGMPVAVFSLEMTSQQLVQRMLCSQAQISMTKLYSGMMSEKRDFPRLTTAASKLADAKVYIDDTAGLSIMSLRAKARRLKQQHDIKMIAIDYLQLLRSESKRAQDNRQQEVAEISSGVKALAKELHVPIIVLAQLNRSPETRGGGSNRPKLSDLRESGSIEQDADMVGLLYRDEYYAENDEDKEKTQGRSTLIIAKQRNGATGDVPLTFRKEIMRFESRARDEQDDMAEG